MNAKSLEINGDNERKQFGKILIDLIIKANPQLKPPGKFGKDIYTYFNKQSFLAKVPKPSEFKGVELDSSISVNFDWFKTIANGDFAYEFTWIDKINGDLKTQSVSFQNFDSFPRNITGDFSINRNPDKIALTNLPNFGRTFGIINTSITDFTGIQSEIDGDLYLYDCKINSLKGFPSVVRGNVYLGKVLIHTQNTLKELKNAAIHGYIKLNECNIENFNDAPTNPEFLGFNFSEYFTRTEVKSYLGLKPNMTDSVTELFVKSLVAIKDLRKELLSENSRRLATYLKILEKYPDFLENETLKKLYLKLNPIYFEDFETYLDFPRYEGIDDSLLQRLTILLKR